MVEPIAYLIVGLLALGMAGSFLVADPRSPTSRPLSLALGLLGAVTLMNIPAYGELWLSVHGWQRVFALLEIGIVVACLEWILRTGRTRVARELEVGEGDGLLRTAQALGCVYGLAGVAFPALRAEVWNTGWSLALFTRPAFYLFAAPFNLAMVFGGIRISQLLRLEVDPAERMRVVAFGLAAPFWAAPIALPARWAPVAMAVGYIVFLAGAIRYHVLQGQRGQFLARFLSPELGRLVAERGLASTLEQHRVELSVVACDLRGFTSFAETAAPEEVMRLLQDYYDTVGSAAVEHGGSIKDFAGDGILCLVGAPIRQADHARRAIDLALGIRERLEPVLGRWRALGLDLGLGIGVSSGFATVGAIGSGRLEYAAVGPVVNLASRLCARAAAGEVLGDQRAVALAEGGGHRFEKIESAELKGFARPVTIFAVDRQPERKATMKNTITVALIGLTAILAAPAARAETAREMLDQAKAVNDAREPKDIMQKMKMTLVDARGGQRVRDLEMYLKNYGHRTGKGITFFLTPAEVKGVGFLAWSYPDKDDDQWLYLPELKRVRQITANVRKQSFQGSDFSYQDLELFDDIRDWTEEDAKSSLVREGEVVDGAACAVIELVPQNKDYEYGRFVVWLDRKDSTVRKVEFYDKKDGALVKTLSLSGFQTIDNLPTPHRMEMANVKKGTKTLMQLSEVKYNQGLSDEIFTQRYLERGRVN